jgi:Skp family chaperone for outer membrane proteins
MRRGGGIAGLKQAQAMKEKQQQLGQDLEKQQLEEMGKQLVEFKTHLENFAVKYKKDIN